MEENVTNPPLVSLPATKEQTTTTMNDIWVARFVVLALSGWEATVVIICCHEREGASCYHQCFVG